MALETPSAATDTRHDVYPHWTWSWLSQVIRVVFIECILRPMVWFLANPSVNRETALDADKPMLLIANHATVYDVPLVLYGLPGRIRRHVAIAMAADILGNWKNMLDQGPWILNLLGPLTRPLVIGLFNVFSLPRSAGFRRSFQHAGEALDHGYNVLVFPEGHLSDEGLLQPFRPGIGLLVAESNTRVLPVALKGLGPMKTGRERWFRSGKLKVAVGSPLSFGQEDDPETITARLHAEMARLLGQ